MNILNKYITIKDTTGIAGQNSDGYWYCKSLPFEDAKDLKEKASEVNKILNELNNKTNNKTKKKEKTETKPRM